MAEEDSEGREDDGEEDFQAKSGAVGTHLCFVGSVRREREKGRRSKSNGLSTQIRFKIRFPRSLILMPISYQEEISIYPSFFLH